MKLTRAQELRLIEVGLSTLINGMKKSPIQVKEEEVDEEVEQPLKKIKRNTTEKGYNYNGQHWTQTAAGKKKMARMMRAKWKNNREGMMKGKNVKKANS